MFILLYLRILFFFFLAINIVNKFFYIFIGFLAFSA
tara:strand:- start:6 stop:113 length:108 start_codon:yes stop_codon:yes gene_type:complete